jgi:hypothetical protein
VTIEYEPTDDSYYLDSVIVDGSSVSSTTYADSYTFSNVTGSHTIAVVYKKYVSIKTSVENGIITASVINQKQPLTKTITYSAKDGYYLESVKVNDSSVSSETYESSYKFASITSDQTIDVIYVPYYSIDASITNGKITGASNKLKKGDTPTVTYEANDGYYVASVQVDNEEQDLDIYESSYTFTSITENHTINITCEKYLSITTSVKNGTITSTDSKIKKNTDKTITYNATDDSYYLASVKVNGAEVSTKSYASAYTFTNINAEQSIEVEYKPYSGIHTTVTNGTITPTISSITQGSSVTIEYAPKDENYYLASVDVDGIAQDVTVYKNEYTFNNVTEAHTITVVYKQYVSILTSAVNGTITESIYNQQQPYSASVQYAPVNGYYLSSIVLNGNELDITKYEQEYAFKNITETQNIEVNYKKYLSIKTNSTHGTITGGSSTIKAGENRTVTYKPEDGYYLYEVLIDGKSIDIVKNPDTYTFSNINTDHTIQLVCKKYNFIKTTVINGEITESSSTIQQNTNFTVQYKGYENYYLKRLLVDDTEVAITTENTNSYTFNDIDKDHTIKVEYAAYQGITTSVTNGTITPSAVNLPLNSEFVVEFQPDENYYLDTILVDGELINHTENQTSYTFKNITDSHDIKVVYKKYVSIITSISNGEITPAIYQQKQGTSQKITYKANEGYYIDTILVNNKYVSVTDFSQEYTFENIEADQAITVTCLPYYSVSTKVTNGIITSSFSECKGQDTYTVVFSPNTNAYLLTAVLDGEDITSTLKDTEENTVLVPINETNHTLEVVYEPFKTITTKVLNGNITKTVTNIRKGDSVKIEYSPNENSYLNSVLVDSSYIDIVPDSELLAQDNTSSSVTEFTEVEDTTVQLETSLVSESMEDMSDTVDSVDSCLANNSMYTFDNITENHTITVEYLPYITVETSVNTGTITPTNNKLHKGDDFTVYYEAGGYYVSNIIIDGKKYPVNGYEVSYTFKNLETSHTIQIELAKYLAIDLYTQNCSVEATKLNNIQAGENITLTIQPDNGYLFQAVYYDGVEQDITPIDNQITITNIQDNMQVEVICMDAIQEIPLAPVLAAQSKKGTGVFKSLTPLVLGTSAGGILVLDKRKRKKQIK